MNGQSDGETEFDICDDYFEDAEFVCSPWFFGDELSCWGWGSQEVERF